MEELLQKWAKLKPPQRLGIAGGVPVAIFVLFYFVLLGGLQTQMEDDEFFKRKELDKQRGFQAVIKNKHVLEQELKLKKSAVDAVEAKIPRKSDPGELIDQIYREAAKARLDLRSLKPDAELRVGQMAFIVNKAEYVGEFHSVGQFFDRLNQLERIVKVLAVGMEAVPPEADTSGNEIKTRVRGKATIVAYRLLTDSEVERSEKANSAGGR
tara:strand:+ start:1181 stop:1813 length:633 start_codon:yes stop_codon:yes gene_type:complete